VNQDRQPAKWNVYTKTYLNDVIRDATAKPNSLVEQFINQMGTRELRQLDIPFDYPKPAAMIRYLMEIMRIDQEGIVLDFFAGSCSSVQAVLELNVADKTDRRFIMVQLPEPCDPKSEAAKAGFANIAEVGKERIRRAIRKLEKAGGISIGNRQESLLEDSVKLDACNLGFRVFKLDTSNIKAWDAEFEDIEGALLSSVENVKPDRTEADVLYELLLKFGLDLAVPIEQRDIAGKTVHIIGAGALIVCLADEIGLDVVEGIAALKTELSPETARVVFKDAGFADDVVKTNAVQILHQAGIEDVRSL